jgi:hypothetical protein
MTLLGPLSDVSEHRRYNGNREWSCTRRLDDTKSMLAPRVTTNARLLLGGAVSYAGSADIILHYSGFEYCVDPLAGTGNCDSFGDAFLSGLNDDEEKEASSDRRSRQGRAFRIDGHREPPDG